MNYTVKLCIIFLILLWNKKYAYTKSCERWVNIFNWLRLISAKSYENHILSIQLVVKTVPNVVMGTDGILHVCLGCDTGYIGRNCDIKCPLPMYGQDCQSICNCRENAFDHVIGCRRSTTSIISFYTSRLWL